MIRLSNDARLKWDDKTRPPEQKNTNSSSTTLGATARDASGGLLPTRYNSGCVQFELTQHRFNNQIIQIHALRGLCNLEGRFLLGWIFP